MQRLQHHQPDIRIILDHQHQRHRPSRSFLFFVRNKHSSRILDAYGLQPGQGRAR